MATKYLALSEDTLLAEYVRLDELKGLFEQRVAVNPDTLAVLIRDGRVAEAGPGGHFAVGGVWRALKDAVAGAHAIRLLLADLKPFQLAQSFPTLTKDGVEVVAEVTFDLQVNPERPVNVLGLMKDHAAVTKAGALARLVPHLDDRVINAAVQRVDALELRGNRGLQDKVQADVMTEVERLAADIGLLVRAVSVTWGTNEAERDEMNTRQRIREQAALEQDARLLQRAVAREAETTVVQLKTALDVEKVKVATEDDLRRLVLSNELAFADARSTGIRLEQMRALEHELRLNRTQRLDGLQAQLEAEQHAIEMARTDGQRRDVEMDVAVREGRHRATIARITAEIREVERSTEAADHQHGLTMQRLTADQAREIADGQRRSQLDGMRGLQDLEISGESQRTDLQIKADDAAHRRVLEERAQGAAAEAEKMRLAGTLSEAQLLAVTAGFSPAVAQVLVERARAATGTDTMALMREMVQQAKDAQVQSEAQARHFFEQGMRGTVGVSQGVGAAAVAMAGRAGHGLGLPDDAGVECPQCHQRVAAVDRFCMNCGRTMRQ